MLKSWYRLTLVKVRLIVSSLAGPFVELFCEKVAKETPQSLLTVEMLSHSERRAIVEKRLRSRGKELSAAQLALLINKTAAVKPLYLTIACEELCIYGNYDMLTETIECMPPSVPDLLQQVLGRLEADIGKELVARAFGALACVEDGLLPYELRILLAEFEPDENDPGRTGPFSLLPLTTVSFSLARLASRVLARRLSFRLLSGLVSLILPSIACWIGACPPHPFFLWPLMLYSDKSQRWRRCGKEGSPT